MYKCIPVAFGVDISVNKSSFFHFDIKTHMVTDLGGGKVRITRRIDGLHELYTSNATDYTDVDGNVISTTADGLTEYFSIGAEGVKAGEGVAVNNGTVSVVAGGPSTLGGYKVGTGLMVDGDGKLSATAASEVTKVLATEAEMLSLATEMLRPYRIIRLDTKKLYYLNSGDSPSVLANWFVGPSIETAVVSFKGRTGVVEPSVGDYTLDTVQAIDKTTSTTYKLVIDNNKLFMEDVSTQERTEIAGQTEISNLEIQYTTLNDIVTGATNGLVPRVVALEARPSGGGTDYSQAIADLQTRDGQLSGLITTVDGKVDSTAANTTVLDQRVSTLEAKPAGKDYSPEITALSDKNVLQDTRLGAIDAKLLNTASLVNGKVPYENLPEFPVGRKVNVANQAARLALSGYADLTIAYQSDTGDAWGLDANADPAITANWSKLGNAQGVGVSAFNGRTGSIGPQTGDYTTGQVTELVDKRYVTSAQITDWGSKETSAGAQTKATAAVSTAKAYADSTFIPVTQKGVASGLAPLGSDGKVPSSYLPTVTPSGDMVIPVTTYKDMKASRVALTWYTNTGTYDRVVRVTTGKRLGKAPSFIEIRDLNSVVYSLQSDDVDNNISYTQIIREVVPAGWSYRIVLATDVARVVNTWLELDMIAGSTFTPVSEKGNVNGVAPLDADKRVPIANLPTFLPQKARTWKDVRSERTYNVWTTNTGGEMEIFIRTNAISDSAKYVTISMRQTTTSGTMVFNSTSEVVTGNRYLTMQATVPAGWQYGVAISGGSASSISDIGIWRELS